MQLQEALDEYRFAILHLADGTQQWYMRRLRDFAKWCAEQGIELVQIKPTTFSKYLYGLANNNSQRTNKPLSTHTVHGHARCIRAFLFWCASEPQNYISSNIPSNLSMPKTKKKIVEIFSDLQIKALFVACECEPFPRLIARDKAAVAVLIDTGVRAAELCDLMMDQVHLTSRDGYIRVTGKGDKERELPLGKKSRQYLHSWIKSYRKAPAEEQHVFLGKKFVQMTPNGLNVMVRRLGRYAKIKGRVYPHMFRHTFAVNFLKQGGDLFVLSRLLGHTSIQVTQVYLQALKSDQARHMSKSVLDGMF